jgi:hypothetical protein
MNVIDESVPLLDKKLDDERKFNIANEKSEGRRRFVYFIISIIHCCFLFTGIGLATYYGHSWDTSSKLSSLYTIITTCVACGVSLHKFRPKDCCLCCCFQQTMEYHPRYFIAVYTYFILLFISSVLTIVFSIEYTTDSFWDSMSKVSIVFTVITVIIGSLTYTHKFSKGQW